MKTLALEKIIEKRNFLLGRIAHRIKQMKIDKCYMTDSLRK